MGLIQNQNPTFLRKSEAERNAFNQAPTIF